MGFFRSWNKREPLSELCRLHTEKALLDDQPKTDTLQPNQQAGDISMAYLTPYTANTGAITINTISDPANAHGLVTVNYPVTTGNYTTGTNAVYTLVSPQYYQAGIGTLGGQPWPTGSNPNQWGVIQQPFTEMAAPMIKPVDRAEFSEEEISQAEQLMEELSA